MQEDDEDEEAIKLLDIKTAVQEEPIVKRKNLVLDWEGKPIPYWLFRLHGLNQTYTCEICGDFIYRGPKVSGEGDATCRQGLISPLSFRPLRSTLQSGGTRRACGSWASPTPCTL